MSNFQQYTGDSRTYAPYPLKDASSGAFRPVVSGDICDFGTNPVPTDGRWASHAGPATVVIDPSVSVAPITQLQVAPHYYNPGVGAPTSGSYPTGAHCTDSVGGEFDCTAGGTPGTWVTAQSATFVPKAGTFVDIRSYITSGTTFDLAAVIAAMEASGGYCYIPPGTWTANASNVALDVADTRFTYKFLGSGRRSVLALPSGMTGSDSLLKANSSSANTFFAHPHVVVEDLQVSGANSPNATFLTVYQRSYRLERVYFQQLKYGVQSSGYCDHVRIDHVGAENMTSGGWIISHTGTGDAWIVDQLFSYKTAGLSIASARGLSVRAVISGWHYFSGCDVTLDAIHLEGDGTTDSNPLITLASCTAHLRSGIIYATPYRNAVTVTDSVGGLTKTVIDEGFQFMQRLDGPATALAAAKCVDIDIPNLNIESEIRLKNVKSHIFGQTTGTSGTVPQPVALKITAAGAAGINSTLGFTAGQAQAMGDVVFRYESGVWVIRPPRFQKPLLHLRQTLNTPNLTMAAIAAGSWVGDQANATYYYKVYYLDADSKHTNSTAEVSATTTALLPLIQLNISTYDAPGTMVIVRGTTSGTYDRWVQVVNGRADLQIVDQGSYVAGQQWSTVSVPSPPSGNQTLNGWLDLDTGKRTLYGTAIPTSGAYVVGDVLWNTAPAAAGTPGWMCTTAGSPGTWKAMGSLAA